MGYCRLPLFPKVILFMSPSLIMTLFLGIVIGQRPRMLYLGLTSIIEVQAFLFARADGLLLREATESVMHSGRMWAHFAQTIMSMYLVSAPPPLTAIKMQA